MPNDRDLNPKRWQLADALRERRVSAGLSTTELAGRLTWTQSRVSRVERGRADPSEADVAAWLEATGAPESERDELVRLVDAISVESATWRYLFSGRGVAARQRTYQELNERASYIANYQPAVIPGLLQTVDYAQRVFELFGVKKDDAGPAAAARVERQVVLSNTNKVIDLLITEAALRLPLGGPAVMRAQYDRISTVSGLPNVNVGIIPLGKPPLAIPMHAFVVRDIPGKGRVITVETLTAELTITAPEDVQRYTDDLELHRRSALFGSEAQALIRAVAGRLD